MDEAKDDMIDIVKFLQNPEPFNQVGAKIPKGKVKVIVQVMAIVQSRSLHWPGLFYMSKSNQ